jgi:ribosomal protein L11 methylase PrmA
VRELVQVAGEGFGPVGHATTAMCLGHLPLMPAGPALDAGCGSGLLGQAWAYDRRGTVIGCDLDDRALAQARASRDAAGLGEVIRLHRAALESIPHDLLDGRVLLANVPEPAHRALLSRLEDPPPGAVISGLRPARAGAIIDAYASHGMRIVRVSVAGGFCAASLIRA